MSTPIPWWEPKLGAAVKSAAMSVIENEYINDGPVTRELEQQLAEITGVKYGVAVNSCTTGLALSLMAAGIKPGDQVIVPDVTFAATANAVKLAGAEVVLVDVESDRLTISIDEVEAATNPKTKAVIAVEFNGRCPDYLKLQAYCEQNHLALICDSSHGLGSKYLDRPLGSYGLANCFSFSAHKMFFAGQGGAIVTNDNEIHRNLRNLRDQGRQTSGPQDDILHSVIGFNFKYPNLLAAIGLAQLKEIKSRIQQANQRHKWYRELLKDSPNISFPGGEPRDGEMILWTDIFVENQLELMNRLESKNIGFRRFWMPLHRQPPYKKEDKKFPNAVHAWKRGVWLPSALSLTYEQAARVAEACIDAAG